MPVPEEDERAVAVGASGGVRACNCFPFFFGLSEKQNLFFRRGDCGGREYLGGIRGRQRPSELGRMMRRRR